MFQRIIHEQWTLIVPVISFVVTASVFTFVTIRALQLPKDRREKLANLPLDSEPKP
ncbi:MAG: hypothetical protein ACSHX7_13875 [Luteolibacter sp.]